MRREHVARVRGLLVAAGIACAASAARADVVLLDEYWTPDIAVNDVTVTEVDTLETGNKAEAKTGEVSVMLANTTGWPNVRFRGATWIELSTYAPEHCEGSIWYRTDAWEGPWRLEIWAHAQEAGPTPLKVMETVLEGEGENGKLLADGEWHEARGRMFESEAYARMPMDRIVPTLVWLTPMDGWDTLHQTYVDRIELRIVSGPNAGGQMAEPARRVRPSRGKQDQGEGWIWWEGEDRVSDTYPPGGPFRPHTLEGQRVLSNGAWLQASDAGTQATWQIDVTEAGDYALWARGYWWEGSFRWRFDDGKWRKADPGHQLDEAQWIHWGNPVYWVRVGSAELAPGRHTFEVVAHPEARGHCFDCWVLSKEPFKPRGKLKPGEERGDG